MVNALMSLVAATCLLSTRADRRAGTFHAMTSSTGQEVCAVDEPTEVDWLSLDGLIECGIKCLVSECCLAYNFNTLDGKCDKYCQPPAVYEVVPGCTGYAAIDIDECLIDNGGCSSHAVCTDTFGSFQCQCLSGFIDDGFSCADCSFPFTYKGQVFYNCTQYIAGLPCDSLGCLQINRTAATCYSHQTGSTFAAQTDQIVVVVGNQTGVPALSVFGWIVFMQRTNFNVNWALAWSNYKNGFGSAGGDFWLGLERLYLLTSSANYRLRVELQWAGNRTWSSAEYWSFVIGDEATTMYQLNVDGYSGDTTDALRTGPYSSDLSNGMPFTTSDADNDPYTYGNCAVYHPGGWWFNACYSACLTCWSNDNQWTIGNWVQSSRMMLKPQ